MSAAKTAKTSDADDTQRGTSGPLVPTPYPRLPTEDEGVILIAKRMLYDLRRSSKDPEMQAKYEAAHLKIVGLPMMPLNISKNDTQVPLGLFGPPGQGKTSCGVEAAKLVASTMGLTFVKNPPDTYMPTKNDFYFVTQEMSGETSKAEFGGLMTKSTVEIEGEKRDYMTKIMNKRIALSEFAGAGVFLLDDFTNASAVIQNLALSVAQEKRFQSADFSKFFIMFTGNLGAADGTTVSPLSNAMISRIEPYYVEDRPTDFIARMLKKYPDAVGDAGIAGFLSRPSGEAVFNMLPDKRGEPFPCPRSWENAMHAMRLAKFEADVGGEHMSHKLHGLENSVAACVGKHAAQQFTTYLREVLSNADPLAKSLVTTGKMDEKVFETEAGGFMTPKQAAFGTHFANALAEHTAAAMLKQVPSDARTLKDNGTPKSQREHDEFMKSFANFVDGATRLKNTDLTYAIECLKQRLLLQSDDLCDIHDVKSPTGNRPRRQLKGWLQYAMAPYFSSLQHEQGPIFRAVIGAITDSKNLGIAMSAPIAKSKATKSTP